jgi:hypothetical protein
MSSNFVREVFEQSRHQGMAWLSTFVLFQQLFSLLSDFFIPAGITNALEVSFYINVDWVPA